MKHVLFLFFLSTLICVPRITQACGQIRTHYINEHENELLGCMKDMASDNVFQAQIANIFENKAVTSQEKENWLPKLIKVTTDKIWDTQTCDKMGLIHALLQHNDTYSVPYWDAQNECTLYELTVPVKDLLNALEVDVAIFMTDNDSFSPGSVISRDDAYEGIPQAFGYGGSTETYAAPALTHSIMDTGLDHRSTRAGYMGYDGDKAFFPGLISYQQRGTNYNDRIYKPLNTTDDKAELYDFVIATKQIAENITKKCNERTDTRTFGESPKSLKAKDSLLKTEDTLDELYQTECDEYTNGNQRYLYVVAINLEEQSAKLKRGILSTFHTGKGIQVKQPIKIDKVKVISGPIKIEKPYSKST